MCNYVTALSLTSLSVSGDESFVLLSLLFSTIAVEFGEEDDNRGSGR